MQKQVIGEFILCIISIFSVSFMVYQIFKRENNKKLAEQKTFLTRKAYKKTCKEK